MANSFLFSLGRKRAVAWPFLARMAAACEGTLLRLAWWLARSLGPDRASATGGWLLQHVGPHLAKNRHVLRNLEIALPEKSTVERKRLASMVWHQTGRVLAEFPHLDRICGEEADRRLEIVDHYGLHEVRNNQQAAVFVTAHYGNWELAAGICRKIPFELAVLHTNFANPAIEDLLMKHRQALGCHFIARQHGARGMIKALQSKRSVGVVMDQRYDQGELVPFFGKPAPTGTAAAAIAIKLGVDLAPVKVERTHGANYRLTFYKPIPPRLDLPKDERAHAMTADVLAHFESWIRERPELWMCLKRRWPKDAQTRPQE